MKALYPNDESLKGATQSKLVALLWVHNECFKKAHYFIGIAKNRLQYSIDKVKGLSAEQYKFDSILDDRAAACRDTLNKIAQIESNRKEIKDKASQEKSAILIKIGELKRNRQSLVSLIKDKEDNRINNINGVNIPAINNAIKEANKDNSVMINAFKAFYRSTHNNQPIEGILIKKQNPSKLIDDVKNCNVDLNSNLLNELRLCISASINEISNIKEDYKHSQWFPIYKSLTDCANKIREEFASKLQIQNINAEINSVLHLQRLASKLQFVILKLKPSA
jgi:hypothetical protein